MKRNLFTLSGETVRYFLCGIVIGGGSILPGVSGGVLAVVLGLYRPMMEFLSHPKEALTQYWKLLPPLGAGMGVGFLLFAKLIALAWAKNDFLATCFFIGLIVGTLPSLEQESRKEGRTKGCLVTFALCAVALFASLQSLGTGHLTGEPSLALYAVCGTVLGLGTVVPGMSASSVLMALGTYAPMMAAVGDLNVGVLVQFIPFTVATVLILARFVTWVFERYYALAFHGILGIVISSTLLIVPTQCTGIAQGILGMFSGVLGCALALWMVKLEPEKS